MKSTGELVHSNPGRSHRLQGGSKAAWCAALVSIASVSGVIGYVLGARQGAGATDAFESRLESVAPKEYYQTTASFSEIEMAKGELSALAARYLAELESRFGQLHGPTSVVRSGRLFERSKATMDVIASLREGAEEFEGTAQYPVLLRHLLVVLKRSGRVEDWVTIYLDLAYRHPTEPLVAQLAPQAIRHGISVGRRREIEDVLLQIGRMPILFEAKSSVQSALGFEDEDEDEEGGPVEGRFRESL